MITLRAMHPQSALRPEPRQLGLLTVGATAIGALLMVSGIVLWLADVVGVVHLLRPWAQISGTFAAMALVGLACWWSGRGRWTRVGYVALAVLCLGTVIDSLDGIPDVFPVVSLLLWVWASGFIYQVGALVQKSRPAMWQRTVGIAVGLVAIAMYGGTASYYLVRNRIDGPIAFDHHPLYVFGIVIDRLLYYLQQHSARPTDARSETPET